MIAKIGEVVLMTWMDGRVAKIAMFAFLVGIAFGVSRVSLEAAVGALLGYTVVWWLFFKKEAAHG